MKYLVGGAENIGMSVCLGDKPTKEIIEDAARALSDNGYQPPYDLVRTEAHVEKVFAVVKK
jgi:hypothetical protein